MFHIGKFDILSPLDIQNVPDAVLRRAAKDLCLDIPEDRTELEVAVYLGMDAISFVTPPAPTPEPKALSEFKANSRTRYEVLVDENPFRAGTGAHYRWEAAQPKIGDSRADLMRRGLTGGDINWCLKKNGALKVLPNS